MEPAPAGLSSAPASRHYRGVKKRAIRTDRRGRAIEAFIALADAITVVRRLLTHACTSHGRDTTRTGRCP